MAKILIVEDEISIQKLIEYELTSSGHECFVCGDGLIAIEMCNKHHFDIVLLDHMLPGKSGVEICEHIRLKNDVTYIIMLTAVNDDENKLKAFSLGADDYIVKPFSIKVVQARIDRAIKRLDSSLQNLEFRNIRVDETQRMVFLNDKEIVLTKTEYELIKYLIKNKEKVITREEILSSVWGYEYVGETRTVDVYAHKLREKLELDNHLKTVRGIGYILRSNYEGDN